MDNTMDILSFSGYISSIATVGYSFRGFAADRRFFILNGLASALIFGMLLMDQDHYRWIWRLYAVLNNACVVLDKKTYCYSSRLLALLYIVASLIRHYYQILNPHVDELQPSHLLYIPTVQYGCKILYLSHLRLRSPLPAGCLLIATFILMIQVAAQHWLDVSARD